MKTLQQLIQETSQNEVFGNIVDQATEDDLAFYFATYEVYGDNFVHFLQRKLKLLKPQYDKYLTIESTQINPLVTEYMRIVQDNKITSEHENDTKHTGYDDVVFGHKNTASGTDSTTYGKTNTRTGSEKHDSDFSSTRTGSESHDTDFSIQYLGSERDTDNTHTDYVGSETTSADGDSASLAAAAPPTSPTTLAGFRASGFTSGVGSEQMSDTHSSTTMSFNNRKDQRGGYTEKTYTNRTDQQEGGDTITYNSVKDQHDGGDTLTYQNVQDSEGGTDSFSHGRTDTESGTNTNNFNSNINDKGGTERNEDLVEEREGYNGVPAELLGSARNYILNTNAFKWLTTELLTCFMDIMEY